MVSFRPAWRLGFLGISMLPFSLRTIFLIKVHLILHI